MYQYSQECLPARNVVVYARVSTEHEAQLSALENQKDWYKPIIDRHPEWNVVRMYVDEGITGTSAKKRPQFMKMIQDADSGEFDLILTREVSRFARNTVDTLQYTRSLKEKGVEVFFINDNIKTFDGDGELRLTIMATLAQDESRKTSMRVKSGQQTSMENGVFYGNGNILGYNRVEKDMIINPDQARTVRMIYDMYLDGAGMRAIQFKLEEEGRLTAMGKTNWHTSNISKILKNSFYCGIITYHKEFTPNYLEQKKIRNFGDIEITTVKGSHEPIVTQEEFERVQQIMASRRGEIPNLAYGERIGKNPPKCVWAKLLVCDCGHKFNRKIWHRGKDSIQYAYQCYSSIRTGTASSRARRGLPTEGICRSPMIPEWKLQLMAKYVFTECLIGKNQILDLAESMLRKHIDDKKAEFDNTKIIEQKEAEYTKFLKRLENLIEMRADGEITRDEFKYMREEVESKLSKLRSEIDSLKLQDNEEEDINQKDKIKILRYYLEQSLTVVEGEDIPEDVIQAFVSKIVVYEDRFDWYLRFSANKIPESLTVQGNKKASKNTPPFVIHNSGCYRRKKELISPIITEISQSTYIKIYEFKIGLKEAKAFQNQYNQNHKIHKWNDLKVSIYL